MFYRERRDHTILISVDCFEKQDYCHCTAYGINPWSDSDADLSVMDIENLIVIRIISQKGKDFLSQFSNVKPLDNNNIINTIEEAHKKVKTELQKANNGLPDYKATGLIVRKASREIWEKYSSRCVSCGACATICPTCSCFLLIDKPGFEKIKQLDACQYPGFERVAGGEDSLFNRSSRFRNRYMCKYVWKPEKFSSVACTGCGRCIEACIGKINKNELFMELAEKI
jgi:ferredoxin